MTVQSTKSLIKPCSFGYLVARHSNKLLTVSVDGGICQHELSANTLKNQTWTMIPAGPIKDREYYVINVGTAKCLTNVELGTEQKQTTGNELVVSNVSGFTSQKWVIWEENNYLILRNDGRSLEVNDEKKGNGDLVRMWKYLQGSNQQWLFVETVS